MAEFINTVDILGDEAVINSIVDRTITEFKDDTAETVGTFAFYSCEALETVDIPNATSVAYQAFANCKALTTVDMPNVTVIGDNAFNYSGPIETANFPNVTKIGVSAFEHSSLRKAIFPNATSLNSYSFRYNSAITEADFPNATNGGNATFMQCHALTRANLPKIPTVVSYMFESCKKLSDVTLSNATTVGAVAFSGCYALTKLDLPKVTKIEGSKSFDCGVKTLILRSETICTLNSGSYLNSSTPIASGAGYVYVPRALVDSYKAATNWSTIASQFRALEDYTVDGTITGELDETKI